MFVELHIIQNFAPSNLNRDDTGATKDCEFGGCRRARISSQCLKRAIRDSFRDEHLLPPDLLATRTKRLVEEVARRLKSQGKDEAQSQAVVQVALQGVKLKLADGAKTQYLLYLAENEIAGLAELCLKHWDKLLAVSRQVPESQGAKPTAKEAKKAGKEAIPTEVVAALEKLLDKAKAADLALFGRMLADIPEKNIVAACQVAHALSTHKVSMEFDFYTAVDDLKPNDIPGADMMGTIEFNSACFYRYANIDMEQLKKNLGGDEAEAVAVARTTLEAFLRASVAAIPTGKQNSMAAQNPPSFVFAVARDSGLWSLANAFVQPVPARGGSGLVQASVSALDTYWGKLINMYGDGRIIDKWCCTMDDNGLTHLKDAKKNTFDEVVSGVLGAVKFAPAQKGAT